MTLEEYRNQQHEIDLVVFHGIFKTQNAHGGRNVMPRCSVRRGRSWGLRQPYVTSHLLPVLILQSRFHESLK